MPAGLYFAGNNLALEKKSAEIHDSNSCVFLILILKKGFISCIGVVQRRILKTKQPSHVRFCQSAQSNVSSFVILLVSLEAVLSKDDQVSCDRLQRGEEREKRVVEWRSRGWGGAMVGEEGETMQMIVGRLIIRYELLMEKVTYFFMECYTVFVFYQRKQQQITQI